MSLELYKSTEYCLIAFDSTHQALRTEKLLKKTGVDNIIIPTLREISSNCGLSIKIYCQQTTAIYKLLGENKIEFSGFYKVEKKYDKNMVSKLF